MLCLETMTFFYLIAYVEIFIHHPYTVLDGVFSFSLQILWNAPIYYSSLLPGLPMNVNTNAQLNGRLPFCFSFG